MSEVLVGRLVGCRVDDNRGMRVGRLSEIEAKKEDEELVVSTYLVGPMSWLHRFAIHGLGLRMRGIAWVYRVRWDQMDLTDAEHPRLLCPREELAKDFLPPRKRGLKRRPGRRLG